MKRRGGVKRLNHWLSAEQCPVLESLPPPVATIDSVVDAQFHVARIFISRGARSRSASENGGRRSFERATLRHGEHGLGMASI